MKIIFPFIRGHAGGDVYFQRLHLAMQQCQIENKIEPYNHFFQYMPIGLKALHKNLKEYDVIHSSAEHGYVFKTRGKPLIVTVHHVIFNPTYRKYLTFYQRCYHQFLFNSMNKSLRTADKIIAVSNNTKKDIQNIFGLTDVEVIHNGIDTQMFKPMTVKNDMFPDKIKLLFIGNLTKRKGADLLPQIMEKLDDRFILLYTSGLRTKKKFSHKKMIPLGTLNPNTLVYVYNQCDILLAPSRLEGFGYSIVEAMACGKPVVTTNISSMPELIDNGKGGFLCKLDDIKMFVRNVNILGDDENLRKNIGEYNRKKAVRDFDLQKMGKKYLTIYEAYTERFDGS